MANHQLLESYKTYRKINRNFQNRISETLKKEVVQRCGKRLGLMKGDTLILSDEDEICVLMDHCIYDHYENGKNAVQRYLADSQMEADSDEYIVLKAMSDAFYTIVQVAKVVRGTGAYVNDIFNDREYLLVDLGLSQSATKGIAFATRIIPFYDFVMTSGVPMPVDKETFLELMGYAKSNFASDGEEYLLLDEKQRVDFIAKTIRSCLSANQVGENVRWEDIDDKPVVEPLSRDEKISRNALCPCGSGKKYKKCCGK